MGKSKVAWVDQSAPFVWVRSVGSQTSGENIEHTLGNQNKCLCGTNIYLAPIVPVFTWDKNKNPRNHCNTYLYGDENGSKKECKHLRSIPGSFSSKYRDNFSFPARQQTRHTVNAELHWNNAGRANLWANKTIEVLGQWTFKSVKMRVSKMHVFNGTFAWRRHLPTAPRMLWGKLQYFFFCEESLVRDTNLYNKDCNEMHSGSQMTSSCKCSIAAGIKTKYKEI